MYAASVWLFLIIKMYLNCHTFFSLRYGTLSPIQLVEVAVQLGLKSLALTDINNTSCALQFVQTCKAKGIKPILGIEFRDAQHKLLYIGLAQNNQGWENLCKLLTTSNLQQKELPEVAPPMDDVFILYAQPIRPLNMMRPYEFISIRTEQLHALHSHILHKHQEKLVALQPLTFLNKKGFRLHKILRAIDKNSLITRLPDSAIAHWNERPLALSALAEQFALYPTLQKNAAMLMEACSIDFETGLQLNRKAYTGSKEEDLQLLRKLALSGCMRRYTAEQHKKAEERVEKELAVIQKQDFGAYFLITWDIVRYARSAGYYHVGRGSGANSIVAYCIGITDVDPLELDLYFERFINPHRASPPDFDIDFSWDERDDVTDYIFKRYGREHTALLATYNTFQLNAAVREVGKVFGLPKAEIDKIVDALPQLLGSGKGEWSWGKRKA